MSIRRALNVPATAVHTVRRAARSLLLFQTICNFSGNGAWKHGTGLSREKLRAPVNVRSGSTSPLTRIPRPAHQRGHAGYTKQPVLPSLPCKHEHATKKAEFLSCISNGQTIQDRDGRCKICYHQKFRHRDASASSNLTMTSQLYTMYTCIVTKVSVPFKGPTVMRYT